MEVDIVRYLLVFLTIALCSEATHTNGSLSSEERRPRVTGRIVKLYSGTRPDPIICAKEGFQADPLDCAVFYRCIKGSSGKFTVFRYQCGPGTVFDPEKDVCNHQKNTKRINCGEKTSFRSAVTSENDVDFGGKQELPSPIHINNIFSTSKPVFHAAVTHFDSNSRWQSVLQQSSRTSPRSISISTNLPRIVSRQTEPDVNCETDGFMGDTQNCRKFYRCVNNGRGGFIKYEFTCSESTVWDDENQACNHPWSVKKRGCGSRLLENRNYDQSNNDDDSHIAASTIQEQSQINYGNKISQTQVQINNGTAIQNQSQINYASNTKQKQKQENYGSNYKQNQNQISHGSAISQSQSQINYGNKGFQSQTQVDHTEQSSQSQTQVSETPNAPNAQVENGNTQPDKTDSKKCSSSGFKADPNDCKKFYRCVDNGKGSYTKYEFTCGEGTVWDSKIDACNHAWAVKGCGGNNQMNSDTEKESTTHKATTQISSQSPVTDTDDYEEISYGNQKPQTTSSSTVKPIQTTSESMDSSNTECKSSGFMGDPKNCKKFYRCVDNGRGSYIKYEFTCGEGTVWDQNIEACNHAWAVKNCGQNEYQPLTTTTNKIESTNEQTTHPISIENDDYASYNPKPEKEPAQETTTSIKPQQSEGSECQSSGFMGDNNDCKKFYRCVDNGQGGFIRYEFICGEGTVWDSKIEACNHKRAVPKCGGVTEEYNKVEETTTSVISTSTHTSLDTDEDSGYEYNKPTPENITNENNNQNANADTCQQEGFMGDSSDCKKFYRCVSDERGHFSKFEFSCGEGTVWDNVLQTCNHPSPQHQCGGGGNNKPPTVQEPMIENDEMYTEATPKPSTDLDQETSSTKQPSLSKESCVSDGFYGDSNDCKKFYRCVENGKGSYTKYDFVCGEGTVWDQEIQACNHETPGKTCKSAQSSSSSSKEPTQQTTETGTIQTTTETSKIPPSSENKDICSSEGFFSNSMDCKKFFRCVGNGKGGFTKYDFTCGEGTAWVQEIQACDHDNDIGTCSVQQSQSPDNQDNKPPDNQDNKPPDNQDIPDKQSDEYPETESTSISRPEPSSMDDDKCTAEGFYGNKNDCKKFYRCVDEGNGKYTRYDFTCGEGTAWDQELQTCNHIGSVQACDGGTQPQQSDSNTGSGETSSTEATNQEPTQSTKPSKDTTCKSEGFFGDPEDCKKFYRCVDNGKGSFTKYEFTCGEGTIWDEDLTTCNHPQDVNNPSCQQSSSDSSPESTSSGSDSSTESTQTTQSSGTTEKDNGNSTEDCGQEDSSSKPIKSKVNCTEAGFYPDPDDCKKFYRCVDWDGNGEKFSVYHFECGEGTIWDPALDTCNHEESVYPPRDCSKQEQSEPVDQETTTESSTTTTEREDQTTAITEKQETTTQTQTTEQQTTQSSKSTTTEKSETTTETMTTKQQEQTTQKTTTTTIEESTTQQSTTQESTTQQSTTQDGTTAQTTQSTQEMTTESNEDTTTQSNPTEETTTQTTESSTSSTTESSDDSTTESMTDQTTESMTDQTTESMTDQTTESMDSTTESSSQGEKECPETDDDQYLYVCPSGFRRHPKYCNLFYQCTEDDDTHEVKVATFHCPNNTIYDENKNQCVDESEADKKCDGEIANRRRFKRLDVNKKEPIVVSTQKRSCPTKGHYPFDKTDECSPAFLKCETSKSGHMRGYVYRCPQSYVYWSVSRRCEPKSYLKNCNNSNTDWSSRYEIPVETRNVSYRTKIDERRSIVQ